MILLDHCVPRRYSRLFKEWGYNAKALIEISSTDISDSKVLALAQMLDAVLFTIDLDFANILNYPPSDYGGIIVMKYQPKFEDRLDFTLKQVLDNLYRDNLRQSLVIISPGRYRVKRN